jgi:hypothetical protein
MLTVLNIFVGFVLFLLIGIDPVWAKDEVDLFYGYYKDDKRLTASTPSIQISKDLLDSTALSIKYTYEKFQKDSPANTMDAVTGATTVSGGTGGGFQELRRETIVGLTQRMGSASIGVGYFHSKESDYLSDAYTGAINLELFKKNLTLTAQYGKTFDEVGKLDEPRLGFPKDKDIDTYTIAATQILTPRLFVTGGYSLSHVDGFQSLPTRKILAIQTFIQGNPIGPIYEEKHPDLRDRQTYFLRFKQYFHSRTSTDLNLSYYRDDWGVRAYAVTPLVQQYLSDSVVLMVHYRYYAQTAADFYQPLYYDSEVTNESLKTADVRLRNFDAHTLGATVGILAFMDWSVYLRYNRYVETNAGLKAHIVELTIQIPY